jgi:hypothetical protein
MDRVGMFEMALRSSLARRVFPSSASRLISAINLSMSL